MNIAIRNESSRAVDWVELEWPGPHVPGGIIPPGAGKTSLGVPWRSAKTGILTFVDDESRKPSRVEISFVDIDSRIASR
ncbi:MAG TPA: hypothetical protein VG734_07100, partial [Lacunisphaera sp.]|nr:hypothetical protein [Lacunisphaera sp.]